MNYTQEIQLNTLAQRRKILGLTQQQVADALGFISADRISHWEKGVTTPNLINLFRLCGVYRCTPQDIYPLLLAKAHEKQSTT